MFDCLKVCLNEKIQFGLVLQQIIRTDHLHLGVIELNLRQINICYIPSFTWSSTHKHGCEECRPKLLWDFELFKMGRSKVSSCRLKDKFEKMRSLESIISQRLVWNSNSCTFLLAPVETRKLSLGGCATNARKQQNCPSGGDGEDERLSCRCQGRCLRTWKPPKTGDRW